jgi:hypothetical protein
MVLFAKSNKQSANPCPHNFGLLHSGQESGLGHGNFRSKSKRRLISTGTDIIIASPFWGFFTETLVGWKDSGCLSKLTVVSPFKIKWASNRGPFNLIIHSCLSIYSENFILFYTLRIWDLTASHKFGRNESLKEMSPNPWPLVEIP